MRSGSDETAEALLKPFIKKASSTQGTDSMILELLSKVVQPVFAASKPRAITQAARRAINPLPEPVSASEDERQMKPWKYERFYVVVTLRWVVTLMEVRPGEPSYSVVIMFNGSKKQTTGIHWRLIVPAVLALLDDGETVSKLRGCKLLQTLLHSTPASLLLTTGIGEVFTDALFPFLSYLPTLTPEDESIPLQDSAYSTLLALVRTRYPNGKDRQPKNRVLDKIMRKGILSGLAHAGEYVQVATLLLNKMSLIIGELGIWSVKHLKVRPPLVQNHFALTSNSISSLY